MIPRINSSGRFAGRLPSPNARASPSEPAAVGGDRADPQRPRDPAEAALVVDRFRWYADEDRSFLAVGQRLHDRKVQSPRGRDDGGIATVRGIRTNPTDTGTLSANRPRGRPARLRRSATHPIGRPRDSPVPLPAAEWIAVAAVPAIVTREWFDRVPAEIATPRSFAKRNHTTTPYLWRAVVRCGMCRWAWIARRTWPTGKTYSICSGKTIRTRQQDGCRCRSRFIPAGVLEESVWSWCGPIG
jgi:site-specific DNA recombinase